MLKQDAMNTLFANTAKIFISHAKILNQMEKQMKLNGGKIGPECVLSSVPLLLETENDYKEYVLKQESCVSKLKELLKNKKFAGIFEDICGSKQTGTAGKGVNVLDLEFQSFSISPIQRFPRYVLLFDSVLKNLSKEDPHHKQILIARQKMDKFCKSVNAHRANVKEPEKNLHHH